MTHSPVSIIFAALLAIDFVAIIESFSYIAKHTKRIDPVHALTLGLIHGLLAGIFFYFSMTL